MAVALEIVGADMWQVDRHCHAGILRDVGKIPAQRGVICGSLPIRFEMGDIDWIKPQQRRKQLQIDFGKDRPRQIAPLFQQGFDAVERLNLQVA